MTNTKKEQFYENNPQDNKPKDLERRINSDADFLYKLRKTLKNVEDEDSEEDENSYKGEDTKNRTNKINENTEKFIQNIESKKSPDLLDKLKSVFKTENGSIYLIAEDGSCLRIKKEGSGIEDPSIGCEFRIEPITRHLYFIDYKTWSSLLELSKQGRLQKAITDINIPIIPPDKITPEAGVYPFDFGLIGYPEIHINLEDNILRITKEPFASGYHLGHQITKIIK